MDQTDEAWLLEHLFYEWSMLNYTIELVQQLPRGNEYNVQHEAFAVHARLFSMFLTNGDTGNYGAQNFVRDFRSRKPDNIKSLYNKIDPQILHLAPKRPSHPDGKLNANGCKTLFDWLRVEFEKFFAQLPADVREKWNNKAAAPAMVSTSETSLQTTSLITGATTFLTTYRRLQSKIK